VQVLKQELEHRGLNAKLIRMENSNYRQREEDLVINWGGGGVDGLNSRAEVAICKDVCLNTLQNNCVPCPDFTTSLESAQEWVREGSSVVCRTLTRGSGGQGIIIANSVEELVSAPLYTRYIKKREEYRVHVFAGEVIDVQRKARNSSVSDDSVNWQVRTHDNGFVFVRQDVELPAAARDMAIQALAATGLTFGAVDLIFNEHHNQYYVLEINTAPGLEGQTITSYADAIQRYAGE
jgi:glutathione synthase/RimK-type ligase-like ATP-grasp enzyme